MKKEELRIVYMGTPDFAVEPLARLVDGGYNVVGVVTMPDKPVGRHQTELAASPVKKYAVARGLPVLQPVKLKDEGFLSELREWRPDLQVVVAFRMLPEVVWALPPHGTFNLHAALLPQYRGAAPINWAIINGDRETGVTTFFLDRDIDTGAIIERERISIEETDNAEDVHDKLMHLGSELVVRTVDRILAGRVEPIPQSELTVDGPLRPAPKIFRDTCQIDWSKSLDDTYNFVRGLSPYPAAWTNFEHGGKRTVLKIYETGKEHGCPHEPVGTVLTDGKEWMKIAQRDGYLHLRSLQLTGKRRMDVAAFLRGFHADGTERVFTE